MSERRHKWWMSAYPSVLEVVLRCNCGATLTSVGTILKALNLKEARIEALEKACKAGLYLLGNDADRVRIGEKPWAPRDATSVPDILRAALAAEEEK